MSSLRTFLRTGALLLACAAPGYMHPHHIPEEARFEESAAAASCVPSGPIISGTGKFRYEYVPQKLVLPRYFCY